MGIRDISQGSRIEVEGIRTVEDAINALEIIDSYPECAGESPELHVFLSGTTFTFWTEGNRS